jgi:hypothetical protein
MTMDFLFKVELIRGCHVLPCGIGNARRYVDGRKVPEL